MRRTRLAALRLAVSVVGVAALGQAADKHAKPYSRFCKPSDLIGTWRLWLFLLRWTVTNPVSSLVRSVLLEHRIQTRQHRPRLHAVTARPDPQVHVRVRNPQVGEEDVRHHRVVVLPGVDDDVLHTGTGEGGGDRAELDELRAGADDTQDLHL